MVAVARKTTFTGLKNLLGPDWSTVNITVCTPNERSLERVQEYCNDPAKDTACQFCDMFRFGVLPSGTTGNQGGAELEHLTHLIRTQQVNSILSAIDNGADIKALAGHIPFFRCLLAEAEPKRGTDFTPRIYWLESAESGTGKSHWVSNGGLEFELEKINLTLPSDKKPYSMDDCYYWAANTGGYAGWVTEDARAKRIWIMEEACGQYASPDGQKRLWDRGPYRMQCKGGFVECCAEIFVVTTNFGLDQWWPKLKEEHPDQWERQYTAVKRRLDEWGITPNFRLFLRQKRLERRLTQEGGIRVREPTRRISPEPMQDDSM